MISYPTKLVLKNKSNSSITRKHNVETNTNKKILFYDRCMQYLRDGQVINTDTMIVGTFQKDVDDWWSLCIDSRWGKQLVKFELNAKRMLLVCNIGQPQGDDESNDLIWFGTMKQLPLWGAIPLYNIPGICFLTKSKEQPVDTKLVLRHTCRINHLTTFRVDATEYTTCPIAGVCKM